MGHLDNFDYLGKPLLISYLGIKKGRTAKSCLPGDKERWGGN